MQSTLTIWITDTPLVSPSAYPVEHGRSVYGTIVNHVCRLRSLQAPLDVSDNDTDTQLSHCTRLHSPIPAYRPAHQPYYPRPSAYSKATQHTSYFCIHHSSFSPSLPRLGACVYKRVQSMRTRSGVGLMVVTVCCVGSDSSSAMGSFGETYQRSFCSVTENMYRTVCEHMGMDE